jgi:hypothetical protein
MTKNIGSPLAVSHEADKRNITFTLLTIFYAGACACGGNITEFVISFYNLKSITTFSNELNMNTYLFKFTLHPWSEDSSVGIETGYGLKDRGVGVRVPVG